MEIVNYNLLKEVNTSLVESEAKIEILTDRLEDLARNENLKYLNFKVIGIAVAVGLIVGFTTGGLVFKNNSSNNNILANSTISLKNKKINSLNNENDNLKKKINSLNNEINFKIDLIKKLRSKILPEKYYGFTTDNGKNRFIGIRNDDARFSYDDLEDGSTRYYIELK